MSSFSLGAVVTRTFASISRSFASVGLLIIGVQIVMTAFQFAVTRPLMVAMANGQGTPFAMFSSPGYWLGIAISFGLYSIVMGGSVHGFLAAGAGRRADLGECLRVGLAKALPMFGLMILWSLAVWVGFILLVVPGLILMTMWSLCIPVLVAEDAGVIGSFGRSRALTKGSRWQIFALLLGVVLAYYVVIFVVLGSALPTPGAPPAAAMAASMAPAMMAGSLIVATVFLFLVPALLASIYAETAKGQFGVASGDLNEVFA